MKTAKEIYEYIRACIKTSKLPTLTLEDFHVIKEKHKELKASVAKLQPNHVICTKCNGITYFYHKKPLYHTCCGKKINWNRAERLKLQQLREKNTFK